MGPSGPVTLNGGTLQWGSSFALDSARTITVGASGGTIDTNGNDVGLGTGYNAAIGGSGTLTKTGAGVYVCIDNPSWTGKLTVKGPMGRRGWKGASWRRASKRRRSRASSPA